MKQEVKLHVLEKMGEEVTVDSRVLSSQELVLIEELVSEDLISKNITSGFLGLFKTTTFQLTESGSKSLKCYRETMTLIEKELSEKVKELKDRKEITKVVRGVLLTKNLTPQEFFLRRRIKAWEYLSFPFSVDFEDLDELVRCSKDNLARNTKHASSRRVYYGFNNLEEGFDIFDELLFWYFIMEDSIDVQNLEYDLTDEYMPDFLDMKRDPAYEGAVMSEILEDPTPTNYEESESSSSYESDSNSSDSDGGSDD